MTLEGQGFGWNQLHQRRRKVRAVTELEGEREKEAENRPVSTTSTTAGNALRTTTEY